MVKIPGTSAGVPAIRQCLSEGININITLLFSVDRYRDVMEAYLSAVECRLERNQPIDRLRSVASFFVSRVDTNVDKKLDVIAKDDSRSAGDRKLAASLRGQIAIANARIAYQAFEDVFGGPRATVLAGRGVAVQRPLWASTSTKDPAYPDLYYAEALIGPQSVDTMPPETFEAFLDHGDVKVRIYDNVDQAHTAIEHLRRLGIDLVQVTQELEEEGVRKFADSFDSLMKAVAGKMKAIGVA
jgi:transaldolase